MNDFQVRPLEAGQLPSVAALFELQLAEHNVERSSAELIAGLEILLAKPTQGFVLVAMAHDKPIGVAYGSCILSLEHGGWSGWLDELYVLPKWRGRGVGSVLLSAVITEAKARGWAALDLEVEVDHARVIPLYERHRFELVRRTRYVRRLRAEQ
ncbi:MAG: GNAT family N-acetyltransferase [Verrucomicrobiota bacterium]|nr:GNAT family N-acetyltransferase [Verrucomicrobiota bacterium]